MVAELQPAGFRAQGAPDELMTQANAKDRNAGLDQGFDRSYGIGQPGWVARTVGEKDAVRL